MIRPQQKRNKAHKEMLANLKKGDHVLTSGGVMGRITGINEQMVVLEIAPEVRIKVSRGAVKRHGRRRSSGRAPGKKEVV